MTRVATIVAIVTLAAVALIVPPGAVAGHCTSSTTSEPLFTHGKYYIVADGAGGLFLYEESGVKKGLQRKDFLVDDTCHGRISADIQLV